MEEQDLLWPRPRFSLLQRPLFRWPQQQRGAQASSSWQQNLAATPEDLEPADLEPAWQWQFRQMEPGLEPAKGEGLEHEGRDWAKPDSKDKPSERGEVFAAAPTAPGEDPYQVAEATKEEIEAAAARQAEREEEGFHAHLWQEAIQQALADPDRPLCARKLVKNGRLTVWWSMSWKDARTQINGALVDEYRDLLWGYFVGPPEGPGKTTGQSFKLKGEPLRAASSRFLARGWSFSQPPYTVPPTRSQPTTATH